MSRKSTSDEKTLEDSKESNESETGSDSLGKESKVELENTTKQAEIPKELRGWMKKEGKGKVSSLLWTKRYFRQKGSSSLNNAYLYYYKTETDTEPKGYKNDLIEKKKFYQLL